VATLDAGLAALQCPHSRMSARHPRCLAAGQWAPFRERTRNRICIGRARLRTTAPSQFRPQAIAALCGVSIDKGTMMNDAVFALAVIAVLLLLASLILLRRCRTGRISAPRRTHGQETLSDHFTVPDDDAIGSSRAGDTMRNINSDDSDSNAGNAGNVSNDAGSDAGSIGWDTSGSGASNDW
jgi:hypothetical protein